jgi:voltage-gated potassium channel
MPVWVSILWRAAFTLGLILLAVMVHWFERDGLRDNADGVISFLDVVYFTMISITTTGYGDIVPVSDQARLFDAVVVTPIRIFVVLIFLGTAYSFVFKRTWDKWRMAILQKNLSDHIIVAGFGTTGSETVDELILRGTDAGDIVVIDCDSGALERAHSLGCAIMQADATRDTTLKAARIATARSIVISGGTDDTSILITLTARHLAPEISISVAIRNEDNELLARQAGATTVINPVSFAGLLLAGSTDGSRVADYLGDLASTSGRVQLVERPVRPDEIGKALSQVGAGLGVRVYRAETPIGFWEEAARSLQEGDWIIEIVPTATCEAD